MKSQIAKILLLCAVSCGSTLKLIAQTNPPLEVKGHVYCGQHAIANWPVYIKGLPVTGSPVFFSDTVYTNSSGFFSATTYLGGSLPPYQEWEVSTYDFTTNSIITDTVSNCNGYSSYDLDGFIVRTDTSLNSCVSFRASAINNDTSTCAISNLILLSFDHVTSSATSISLTASNTLIGKNELCISCSSFNSCSYAVGYGDTSLNSFLKANYYDSTQNVLWTAGISDSTKLLLLKTDLEGDILLSREYAVQGNIQWVTMVSADNNDLLIGADVYYAFFLLRVDTLGNVVWSKSYSNLDPPTIIRSSGDTYFIGTTGHDIMRIDGNGNILFQKGYFDLLSDMAIYPSGNGGCVFISSYPDSNNRGVAFCEIDSNGNMLRAKLISLNRNNTSLLPSGIIQTSDGGYAIRGMWQDDITYQENTFLLKVSSSLNFSWIRMLDVRNYYDQTLIQDKYGSLYLTANGWTGHVVAKYDANGNFRWLKQLDHMSGYVDLTNTNNNPDNIIVIGSSYTIPIGTGVPCLPGYAAFHICDSLPTCTDTLVGCVWPGDANADGIADVDDILPIGIGYGSSGPLRPNATTSWIGQPMQDWSQNFVSVGQNYKHADCDGSGVIDTFDVQTINDNYGLVHFKREEASKTGIPVYVDFPPGFYPAGSAVSAQVMLGTATSQVSDFYGIVFRIYYNAAVVQPGSVTVDFDSTWIGTEGVDLVGIYEELSTIGRVDAGVTRIDHTTRAGYGQIATLNYILIDDIAGKGGATQMLGLNMVQAYAISNDESEIELDILSDLEENSAQNDVRVFPVPASEQLVIEYPSVHNCMIQLFDITGRNLFERETENNSQVTVDTKPFENGVYFLRLKMENGFVMKKIVISR